jgi:predicted phage terminase large subunit-like protein
MGSARYEAQYQQNPLPPEGNIIKAKWLKLVEKVPEFQYVAMSVDVAGTSGTGDYSAFLVWGYRDKIWYLTDVYRERLNAVEFNSLYKKIDRTHEPDCTIIEVNGIGQSVVHYLRKDGLSHVHGASVAGDKATRCEAITPMLERGEVAILKSMNLFETLMAELLTFPAVPHDDMVDAFVLLLHRQKSVLQKSRWYRRPKRSHMPHTSEIRDGGFVISRASGVDRYAERIGIPLF